MMCRQKASKLLSFIHRVQRKLSGSDLTTLALIRRFITGDSSPGRVQTKTNRSFIQFYENM